uniref:Uncharacterized protein n=1 Tax=Spongospora subterranea TaxID=70186 RepID=A0A0H5QQ49_9EUKA|eukprot:CRZ03566.1 hypothetical protein [Spongospora subterranea]
MEIGDHDPLIEQRPIHDPILISQPPPAAFRELGYPYQTTVFTTLSLAWPTVFLIRTLSALYMPGYRVWLALLITVPIVIASVYSVLTLSYHRPAVPIPVRLILQISLFECIANLLLMIGSGSVIAPISCMIPILHVHFRSRPFLTPALITAAGGVLTVASVYRDVHPRYAALLACSPIFRAMADRCRYRLHVAALTNDPILDAITALFQVVWWLSLTPISFPLQSFVVPFPTHLHPFSRSMFEQPNAIVIIVLIVFLTLLCVNFALVLALADRRSLKGASLIEWAARGYDLSGLLEPFILNLTRIFGTGLGFFATIMLFPLDESLAGVLGALLILVGTAMQFDTAPSSPIFIVSDLGS